MRLTRRAWLAAGAAALAGSARAGVRDTEYRLHGAINLQRRMHGLPPLDWSPDLAAAARHHSERMLSAGFFSHLDPELGDLARRLSAAGVPWARIAENIFREQGYDDPVALALVEWMYSAGHRANLLGPEFTETGIGVAVSREREYYITQQFLRRR